MKTDRFTALRYSLILVAALTAHGAQAADGVKVSLAGLDLASPQGQTIARERIHQAARVACARVVDPYNLAPSFGYINCVARSEKSALQQIQPSTVAAAK